MKILTLKRLSDQPGNGTLGVIFDGYDPFAVTLEPSWRDNQHNISCIPVGEWQCKRILSPRFGDTFEIICPPRIEVEFHKGNFAFETHGCVILGNYFERNQDGTTFVADSGHAFDSFRRKLSGENEFKLVIVSVPWS